MIRGVAVVINGELKPIMRDFLQGDGHRRKASVLDLLTVREELIPGVVRARNGNAGRFENLGVDIHALPVTIDRHAVDLAVHCGGNEHLVLHVARIVGICRTDLVEGDDLAGGDDRVGVVAIEIEEYIGFRAGFKVRHDLGFPLLIGCGGSIHHGVARRGFIAGERSFVIGAVAVVSTVRGDDRQANGFRCRGRFGCRRSGFGRGRLFRGRGCGRLACRKSG
ncbi:hypothetical protein SDC9_150975 [bioreactor metagenome]|uniref:Uncharacterized protein n=1 Tax=bioreactor metagenome TaxID=1076179 RepID=A0A645ET91_9ZZZZ